MADSMADDEVETAFPVSLAVFAAFAISDS